MIYWHKGLRLCPQHFQMLEEDYLHSIYNTVKPVFGGNHGLLDFKAVLNESRFEINKFEAITQNGLYLRYSGNDTSEYSNLKIFNNRKKFEEVIKKNQNKEVKFGIGVAKLSSEVNNYYKEDALHSSVDQPDSIQGYGRRFVVNTIPYYDRSEDGQKIDIRKSYYRGVIVYENEQNTSDYDVVWIGKIAINPSSSSRVHFFDKYCGPLLNIRAWDPLHEDIKKYIDIIQNLARKQKEDFKDMPGDQEVQLKSKIVINVVQHKILVSHLFRVKTMVSDEYVDPGKLYSEIVSAFFAMNCVQGFTDNKIDTEEIKLEKEQPYGSFDKILSHWQKVTDDQFIQRKIYTQYSYIKAEECIIIKDGKELLEKLSASQIYFAIEMTDKTKRDYFDEEILNRKSFVLTNIYYRDSRLSGAILKKGSPNFIKNDEFVAYYEVETSGDEFKRAISNDLLDKDKDEFALIMKFPSGSSIKDSFKTAHIYIVER